MERHIQFQNHWDVLRNSNSMETQILFPLHPGQNYRSPSSDIGIIKSAGDSFNSEKPVIGGDSCIRDLDLLFIFNPSGQRLNGTLTVVRRCWCGGARHRRALGRRGSEGRRGTMRGRWINGVAETGRVSEKMSWVWVGNTENESWEKIREMSRAKKRVGARKTS